MHTFPQGLLQHTASGEQSSSSVHVSALNGHSVSIGHFEIISDFESTPERENKSYSKNDTNTLFFIHYDQLPNKMFNMQLNKF